MPTHVSAIPQPSWMCRIFWPGFSGVIRAPDPTKVSVWEEMIVQDLRECEMRIDSITTQESGAKPHTAPQGVKLQDTYARSQTPVRTRSQTPI